MEFFFDVDGSFGIFLRLIETENNVNVNLNANFNLNLNVNLNANVAFVGL